MLCKCDFCNATAVYDGKTLIGPWAYMCEAHFKQCGINVKGMYNKLKIESTTKICSKCHVEKALTDFYAYTDDRGIPRTRTECKECNLAMRKIANFHKEEK